MADDCRKCPTASEVECRYCHITRHVIEHHNGHPLCFTDEEHEFGTWSPEGPPNPTPSLPDPPDLVDLHYQRERETIIRTLGEGCTCRPDDGSTDPFGPDGCHRAALCMMEHEDRARRDRLDRACELLQVARDTFRVYQHSGGPVDSAIAAFLAASRPDVAPQPEDR